MAKLISTGELMQRLEARYSGDAWAFIPQVPDATGMQKVRTADAVAMGLWPSRGIHLHGFEVKISRSDWLKELRTPAKAESIARYCHKWWLVVAGPNIVHDGELPDGWGLLVAHGGKVLKAAKDAPLREPAAPSWAFLAGLLRAASRSVTPDAELRRAMDEGYKRGMAAAESQQKYRREHLDRLETAVRDFEKASGIRINEWGNMGNVGAAVRAIQSGALGHAHDTAENIKWQAERLIKLADEMLATKEPPKPSKFTAEPNEIDR